VQEQRTKKKKVPAADVIADVIVSLIINFDFKESHHSLLKTKLNMNHQSQNKCKMMITFTSKHHITYFLYCFKLIKG